MSGAAQPARPTRPSVDALLRHHDWVRSLARSLVADQATADDLAQEAWIAALRNPPSSDGAVRAWFRRVLTNRLRNEARRRERQERREAAVARPEGRSSTQHLVERAEALRAVTDAVLSLPEPFRGTILAHYFDGLAPQAIAERDGVPASTVRSRLVRARARLRERLDERSEDGGRAWLGALLLLPSGTAEDVEASVLAPPGARFWIGTAGVVAALVVAVVVAGLPERPTQARSETQAAVPADAVVDDTTRRGARVRSADVDGEPGTTNQRASDSGAEPSGGATAGTAAEPLIRQVIGHDGEPLAAARVRIGLTLRDARPATVETTSGPDGRLVLTAPALEALRIADFVEITAAGHASLHGGEELLVGDTGPLELAPELVLSGRVLDAGGDPLPAARITVRGRPETAFSDHEGRFRLSALSARAHVLVVRTDGHVRERVHLPRSESGLLAVGDVRLRAGHVLRGRAVGPARHAQVELIDPDDDSILARTQADSRGRFEFRNAPDRAVDVRVTQHVGAPDTAAGMQAVRRGVRPGDELEIPLTDAATLRLWLNDAETRLPLELRRVQLVVRDDEGVIVLRRSWPRGTQSSLRVALAPGRYSVEVRAQDRGVGRLADLVVPADRGVSHLVPMPRAAAPPPVATPR